VGRDRRTAGDDRAEGGPVSEIESRARARVAETLTSLAAAETTIAEILTRKAPGATALIAMHAATATAYTRAAAQQRGSGR
jgi:hypothetical protein